jgi:hypothetical protein
MGRIFINNEMQYNYCWPENRITMTLRQIINLNLLIGSLIIATLSSTQAGEVINLGPEECKHGLLFQPNGPFAVMLFCEDALGDHIGVIYYTPMRDLHEGKWSLTDRFWQNRDWGADVTALAWDNTGKYLIVTTSSIYGSGAVYCLDLMNRKATKLFPQPKYKKEMEKIEIVCRPKILGIYEDTQTVDILFDDCWGHAKVQVRFEYKFCGQQPHQPDAE